MRSIFLERLAPVAMIWASLIGSTVAQESGGNGLVNPGFESADIGDQNGTSVAERSAIQAHAGEWCLRIGDSNRDEIEYHNRPSTRVSLQGGGQFYAEGWMRIDNAADNRTGYGTASLEIAFYAADGKYISKQNVGATSSARKVAHDRSSRHRLFHCLGGSG